MIVDAGILYALADRDDHFHNSARAIFALPEHKLVPEPVIVEVDFLIRSTLGVDEEIAFVKGLATDAFVIEPTTPVDRDRAAELVERYRDLRIGYVDAVVVAVAERLKERRIATVDRRDFAAIRPRHVEAFELLP